MSQYDALNPPYQYTVPKIIWILTITSNKEVYWWLVGCDVGSLLKWGRGPLCLRLDWSWAGVRYVWDSTEVGQRFVTRRNVVFTVRKEDSIYTISLLQGGRRWHLVGTGRFEQLMEYVASPDALSRGWGISNCWWMIRRMLMACS